MKIHHMIERVEAAEEQDDLRTEEDRLFNPDKSLSSIMKDWCGVTTFEFGRIANIDKDLGESMIAYANELARHNLFHLPFQKIIISLSVGEMSGATILAEETEGTIIFSVFTALKNPPIFISHCWSQIRSDERGIMLNPSKCLVGKFIDVRDRTTVAKTTQSTVPTWAIGALAMLEAKDIEQRITPPSHALNKRRAAQGRPAIGEIREVLVRVGKALYRPSGEAEKGSHTSPRLHWRRGHVRQLPSGKITHVRPHLVGERVGDEEPAKKVYRVVS